METVQGHVPMPDPFDVLTPAQLLIIYGILERGEYRLTQVAYLSGWHYSEWQPLSDDLTELAFSAYHSLFKSLAVDDYGQPYMYRLPGRREWAEDKPRVSD